MVLDFLRERRVCTTADVAGEFDVTISSAAHALRKLREEGRVRMSGQTTATRWEYVRD